MKLNLPLLQLLMILGIIFMAGCTIRNTSVAGEQNTLLDTDWVLLSFAENEVPATPKTNTSFIHFDSENDKVKGFAGCNRFFGTYTLKGERLSLHSLGSTRMACPDIEVENYLMKVFETVTSYKIAGELLTLYSKNTAVAIFRAGEAQRPDHEVVPEGQQ
ncbi:META domain-containing protein [Pontibacter beigongshangensis]|uniref:META domain-containing protein n=1 Tax=Pontibacter beigongshangensis TaxID=2574733 RepID=UPI001650427B|nr:META domain-containing protein [Pontibacter beigongshangensis]